MSDRINKSPDESQTSSSSLMAETVTGGKEVIASSNLVGSASTTPDGTSSIVRDTSCRRSSWHQQVSTASFHGTSISSNLDPALLSECAELVQGEHKEDALLKFFAAIDTDKTESLNRSELFFFFREAANRLNLTMDDDIIAMAVEGLMEDVGCGGEAISKEQFLKIFQDHPDMYVCFETERAMNDRIDQVHDFTPSTKDKTKSRKRNEEVWKHAKVGWRNKRQYIFWVGLYTAACLAIFINAAIKWADTPEAIDVFGNCIIVARASAATMNLNAALILMPIAKHSLTWARSSSGNLRFLLYPFDAAIDFHMMIGMVFACLAMAHALSHVCDYVRLVDADPEDIEVLLGPGIPESKAGRWGFLMKQRATITGIIMVCCFAGAFTVIRSRRTNFNRFWYFHHLLLVMLVMMCIHGTGNILQSYQTIYWVCGPLALYAIPRIYREVKCQALQVRHAQIHGDILDLRLSKPISWGYRQKAGQYALINIPEISRFEWHPFTLSSSPEQDYIGFHIKDSGDWTKKAHALMQQSLGGGESELDKTNGPIVRVEGPVGASSQGYRDHEVVVLIGAGVGITPMISVIQSLLANPGRVKKAFFYWTVRDNSSFEVFENLMETIYEQDTTNMIELRHFVTSMKKDDRDFTNVLFHYAANTVHADTNMDIFLGHRSNHQIEVGRPDWKKELGHVCNIVRELNEKDCGIFLCGPEKMAEEVREVSLNMTKQCPDIHMYFTKETF